MNQAVGESLPVQQYSSGVTRDKALCTESTLTLASKVYASPKAYGLLLGSGVSRAAGIPTGHEITEDLVRRLASIKSAVDSVDHKDWYKKTFGREANYKNVIEDLPELHVNFIH